MAIPKSSSRPTIEHFVAEHEAARDIITKYKLQ